MPDQKAITDTASVLAAMTQQTMEARATKATRLTPLATEARLVPKMPDLPTVFMPQEQMFTVTREIRHYAEKLIKLCDQIYVALGSEPPAPVSAYVYPTDAAAAARKIAEAATIDEAVAVVSDFNADFAAKAAAAQAATFKAPSAAAVALAEDMGVDESETANGWVCPEHGVAIAAKTRLDRDYRKCPECSQFEHLR